MDDHSVGSLNKSLCKRLRSGEKVKCPQCKDGHYVTDAEDVSKSHFFYCNRCDNFIHFEPNVIVE